MYNSQFETKSWEFAPLSFGNTSGLSNDCVSQNYFPQKGLTAICAEE